MRPSHHQPTAYGGNEGARIEANVAVHDRLATSLTHNGAYLLLWAGQFISQMGDRLVMVALPWLVHRHTGSALSTGIVLAIYTMPYVLFGSVAGVLIDRWNKRLIMVGADIARCAIVLVIPLAATKSIAIVYVLAFAMACASVFFDPSKLAILPEIVPGHKLLRANSLLAIGENATEVLGYSAAGILLAYVPIDTAFRIDAASFAASAFALLLMRYRPAPRSSITRGASSVGRELYDGLRYLRRHRGLRANTLITLAAAAGSGATYPLTFFLAVQVLDGGTVAFGLLEGALGLGYLIGAIAMALLAGATRKGRVMVLGFSVVGVSLVIVAASPTVWFATLPFLVAGVANACALLAVDTYVQEVTPNALRGRIWGARFTLTQGVYAASVLVGAALIGAIDVRTLLIAAGAMIAIPSIAGLFVRDVRDA